MKPAGWFGQIAKGHDHCFPDHKTIEASPDVFAEGCKVVRVGDAVANHRGSCSKHPTSHGGKVSKGSASVFVNGKPMAREGDTVKCATGQTAPLLQGRASVLVGDASPFAEVPRNPSLTPPATPDADSSDPEPKATSAAAPGPLPPPTDYDKGRLTELSAVMSWTEQGRKTLARLKETGTEVVFGPEGFGSYFTRSKLNGGGPNRITLESGLSVMRQILILEHETHHLDAFLTGISQVERIRTSSRTEFVRGMMTEEVDANIRRLHAREEYVALVGSGKLTVSQESDLKNQSIVYLQGFSYAEGENRGIRELLKQNPRASREQIAYAGVAGARRRMVEDYLRGRITTSTTKQTYLEFYEEVYDKYHEQLRKNTG